MQRLLRACVPAVALFAVLGGGTAAAALPGTGAAAAALASPAVKDCGAGRSLVRPASMILTCADNGELADHLTWSRWGPALATAVGTVTWRVCTPNCADSKRWDSARADVTLADPAREPGKRVLFTRLILHVIGWTPHGFIRDITFSEAPVAAPAHRAGGPGSRGPGTHRVRPQAASGTLGYAQIEGFWVSARGPSGSDGAVPGYTYPQVAAAITGAESSFYPGIIQPGVDYCGAGADRAGWGLWQITCGNSVPQYGTDFQILDPWNNAEEAVYKYDQAGGFSPWSTYTSGAYAHYLQHTGASQSENDPGEYYQINSTPPGTPSSPGANPGSTYGPPESGYLYLATSTNGGQVLNAAGCGNPAHVVQWAFTTGSCPSGGSNEEWYVSNYSGGATSIWARYGNNYMCMNVTAYKYSSGTQILAYNCDNSHGGVTPNEKFYISCYGSWCVIKPVGNPSLCLNVAGGNGQGHNVILYACNGGYTNEQFTINKWP